MRQVERYAPWWHPLGDGDPQWENEDDGFVICPHCKQQGCAQCGWVGSVEKVLDEETAKQ